MPLELVKKLFDVNFIRFPRLLILKVEIQKCSQILCVRKPYSLMPDHKLWIKVYVCT